MSSSDQSHRRLQRSIIRRSILLLALVAPGFLLNYGLLHTASRLLDVTGFGVFYAAISIIHTLIAPAVILGFYFSRQMTEGRALHGNAAAIDVFRRFTRGLLLWGAVGMVLLGIGLFATGSVVGVESMPLIAAIVFATFTCYLVESVRAGLQGLERFGWLGGAGLIWMALKFGLGVLGILALHNAWGGIVGIALSGLPVFIGFRIWLLRKRGSDTEAVHTPLRLGRLPLFMLSFGLFAFLSYLDIILAYFVLDRVELGIYSASSALPKALIVLALPIVQVLFPVLVGDRARNDGRPASLVKGLGLTLAFCVTGAGGLHLLDGVFCSSALGLKSCAEPILDVLVWATVPLALLRVLVLHQLAARRDRHPLLLVIPTVIFVVYCSTASWTGPDLASAYFRLAWSAMLFYGIACLPWSRLLSRSSGSS